MTKKHMAIAAYMVANPKAKQTEIARIFDLSETQISLIVNSPIFKDYLNNLLKEVWHDAAKMAQDQMIKLAEQGDYKAIAYILDSNNYQPKQQVELDVGNTISINIV